MKITHLILAAIICLGISPAFAQHEVGNGGDRVRMGFIKEGKEILSRISKSPAALELLIINKITISDLRKTLTIQTVRVSEDILIDNGGSTADAIFKDEHIWLYRPSWLEIMKTNTILDQLILHEMLRAIHFNDDNYILSAEVIPILPPQRAVSKGILSRAINAAQVRELQQQQQQAPPEHSDPFSFHAAANAYEKGKSPRLSSLIGKWKLQGITELSEFPDATIPELDTRENVIAESLYRAGGMIAIGDEGIPYSPRELVFEEETLFDGTKSASASLLHLSTDGRDTRQGPNAISINDSGAVFSQWSYSGAFTGANSQLEKNTYYHYACKTYPGARLICEIKLEAAHSETMPKALLPYLGRAVFYLLYKKAE